MAEPSHIVKEVDALLGSATLAGRRFVVTAGATIEAIDPVRYISNHSTGKMGYAVAGELAARGAAVTLVSGRTNLATPEGVDRVDVVSAEDMYNATVKAFEGADGAVMCAAVADYTPVTVADEKIKKGDGDMSIELRRTKDIAAELGREKGGRLLVGFALETENGAANAREKLDRKNLDFIVLNSLRDAGAGFGCDTNVVSLIDRVSCVELPLLRKDFTLDEYQIYEAKCIGADAVLLICSLLSAAQLGEYLAQAQELGLSALVEAHTAGEVQMALAAGAEIIGVNNRNLKDFSVNPLNSLRLRDAIPASKLFVAESGIQCAADARALKQAGVQAVLVGEALMRSADAAAMLKEMRDA